MTTTVTNYPSEASSRMKTRSMPSFYPLGLTGATAAGTGITGASPDFPSPSMTYKRPPQAWVVYLPRNGELENPSEIVAKIVWPDAQEQSEPDATAWRGVFAPSYNRPLHEFGRSQSTSLSRTGEPRRGQRISLRDARQIALQTLAETERRLEEERAAEARFLLSSWEDENSGA